MTISMQKNRTCTSTDQSHSSNLSFTLLKLIEAKGQTEVMESALWCQIGYEQLIIWWNVRDVKKKYLFLMSGAVVSKIELIIEDIDNKSRLDFPKEQEGKKLTKLNYHTDWQTIWFQTYVLLWPRNDKKGSML